ncbi:cell adhesion molecule-related/down-regulated by oncogenes-like [Saccoglossus kowalevskii]|uniref:Cell adhesion molecule-related/down-regulated by oncogenes-like n=1 Tax=Saccoglossus kowalevskii TaxID=10224 RepID=A0ABM0N140_SACKO|nr:PREDICTED: cell adhesion molecule-related/down-regulated by oncogenes-like [Saccoglossus kowalevskii]
MIRILGLKTAVCLTETKMDCKVNEEIIHGQDCGEFVMKDAEIAPRFVQQPEPQVVRKKSKVRFYCVAEPSNVQIRWKYNRQFISASDDADYDIRGSQLIIRSFRHEKNIFTHTGHYQCIVNNSVGAIASVPVLLQAAYIKPFTEEMDPITYATKGDTTIIHCSPPESLPPARVEYRFQGEWIAFATERMKILPSGNLQIANVSLQDKGNYKCSAYNTVAEKRQTPVNSTKLVIIDDDSTHEDRPAQIISTTKATVRVGENATLECVGSGKPFPTMSWMRQNDPMPTERTSQYFGNLIIHNVQASDEGPYLCVATNDIGFPYRKQVLLSVIVPPVITRPPEDVSARIGDTVRFLCEISGGNPITDITWLFNSNPISEMSLKHSLLGEQLRVHEISEAQFGMYQCMVQNREGIVQASARLQLKIGYPEILKPPVDMTVFEGEPVFISCGVEGDPAPTVAWLKDFDIGVMNTHRTFVSEGRMGGLTILNALRQDEGEYQCIAENIHSQVSESAYLKVEVPNPPRKPWITKTSDTSVKVEWNWDKADNGDSPLTMFKVQYRDVHSLDGYIMASDTITPDTRMYEVTNLLPDSIYRFRIIASNIYGDSRPSELSHRYLLKADRSSTERYVRPPEVAPHIINTKALNSTAIRVKWEYIASHDGVPINGFYIYHRETDSDDDKDYIQETVQGVNNRMFVITNLDPETSYDIKMQSFNNGGAGDFSNVMIRETIPLYMSTTVHPTTVKYYTTKVMADVDDSNSSIDDRSDTEMLYMIIGIAVGIMVLLIAIFVAMCLWKSKQYSGNPVTKVDIDWNKRQYYDPNYPTFIDNTSVNGSTIPCNALNIPEQRVTSSPSPLPPPPLPPLPPLPPQFGLPSGHVYCHDISAVNFNNPQDYKEIEPNIINSPLSHDMSFTSNRSDHSYGTSVSEHNKRNIDAYFLNGTGNTISSTSSRCGCCHGNVKEPLCTCDHPHSHTNSRSNRHRKQYKDHHVQKPTADCNCSSTYSGTESDQCLSDPPPILPPTGLSFTDIKPISKPRQSEL